MKKQRRKDTYWLDHNIKVGTILTWGDWGTGWMGALIVVQKLRNRISLVRYSYLHHECYLSNFQEYTPLQLLKRLNDLTGLEGLSVRETIDISELRFDLSEDSKLKLKKI
jgi:hypothetical protein